MSTEQGIWGAGKYTGPGSDDRAWVGQQQRRGWQVVRHLGGRRDRVRQLREGMGERGRGMKDEKKRGVYNLWLWWWEWGDGVTGGGENMRKEVKFVFGMPGEHPKDEVQEAIIMTTIISTWALCLHWCLHAQYVWLVATPWTVACPPGSSVYKIFQARILDWVAFSSSRDLPDPGIKLESPASPAL